MLDLKILAHLNLTFTLRYKMNITVHSRNRLYKTFSKWDVPREFSDTIANYLVYGYEPGSCFTSILANDFMRAIQHSHPANTVNAFKSLAGWIAEHCPEEAWGSYARVNNWCYLKSEQRRSILEYCDLIYSSKEEVMLILKDTPSNEPVLY